MPLTLFQKEILKLIAVNRSPESHIAGGIGLNKSDNSPRFSADIDVFHDLKDAVALSALSDEKTLITNGYSVNWVLQQPMFYRALVTKGEQSIKLEWVFDSAFRFFPVSKDEELGYVLHKFDLATNKVLALANRSEIRDVIDIVELHQKWLPLTAYVWAGCGKDPGFTPQMILDAIRRNAKFSPQSLSLEQLSAEVDIHRLKRDLLGAIDQASSQIEILPVEQVGCVYLNELSEPAFEIPDDVQFKSLTPHFGSIGGAWPEVI
jgi:hypothetical protein